MRTSILLLCFALCLVQWAQAQKCVSSDDNLCTAIRHHRFVVKARIKAVVDLGTVVKYQVQVLINYKEDCGPLLWIYAPPCLERLNPRQLYLLFLDVDVDLKFWLAPSFNTLWSSLGVKGMTTLRVCTQPCGPVCMIFCEYGNVLDEQGCPTCACNPPPVTECPNLKCKTCANGNVLDENGCPTCACNPCPPGVSQVECFVEPCSLQATECPEAAFCVDDYCGGCNAHYYDANGNEICQSKPECGPVCDIYCEYGHVLDENGCPTCACNPCPPGVPQAMCLIEPCSLQATDCPEAATCVDDYCGGCSAHYYDANGQEICQPEPHCGPVCQIFCKYGHILDENGCPRCGCNPCPPGVPEVKCFVEPCALQATHCPQAATCVDDYCGGCHAHYYDENGTEICLS